MSYQLDPIREPRIVHEWEDGSHWIRASINLYRGKVLLDVRQWYEPAPGRPMRPGAKGISVSAESLDELEAAVAAFRAALVPAGRRRQ